VLRVSAAAENIGVPSASIVCEGFLGQAKTLAPGLGFSTLPLAVIEGHVDALSKEQLRDVVLNQTLARVVNCLTGNAAGDALANEPSTSEVVFEGTFEQVNDHFYGNLWSDGLPIVPPTRERVEAFLKYTRRDPGEVIGVAHPDNRAVTIWNTAVNGVMAGCRPEYMPILIALMEVMTDPGYGNEHSGNTPGSEAQIVLNGPIIKELGFNYEQGALRDGVQANTTIGRFWRLCLRNLAGLLLHQNDKGTFGGTWRVVAAENEDTLREIGWDPLCVDNGLKEGGNAVTVARFTGGNVLSTVVGNTAEELLPYVADGLKKHTGWELIFTLGLAPGTFRPMVLMTPIIARTIANSGFSKADVRQFLFEQARIPAWLFEKYISGWTDLVPGKRTLFDMAKLGKAPKMFAESRDPNRLVPIVLKPEDILITVTGDPLRTNCHILISNGMLGFPTTKKIELPENWLEMINQTPART
jgi:hypothetical protein